MGIKNIIEKFICKIGFHKWEKGYVNSFLSPLAYKCKRCKIVRVFHGWGYTYHTDIKEKKQ